jgi:HEAT repeat protein
MDDLRSDTDLPPGIRYDADLAVHEPATAPAEPAPPSRRLSPLLLFPIGLAALALLVYALFGLVASEDRRSRDYLEEIRLNRRAAWQPAYELSRLLPGEEPARRDARFVPDLLALFEEAHDADPRVRRYLALGLGELRDPRAVTALASALADTDIETRLYAAWGLGAIGDRRGADAVAALLDDSEPDIRKVAAYALGALGGPDAAARLRPLLNDPVDDVAWNAALGLARLGDPAGAPLIGRMLDRRYLDGIVRADADGTVRPLTQAQQEEAILNALRAAALLRDPALLAPARALRDGDPSLRVRQGAFEALAVFESANR